METFSKQKPFNEKYFNEAVNYIMTYYNNKALIMSHFGVALGILALADSINDVAATSDFSKQIITAFNEYRLKSINDKYLTIRFNEIHEGIEKLRRAQKIWGGVKLICSAALATFGYRSNDAMAGVS